MLALKPPVPPLVSKAKLVLAVTPTYAHDNNRNYEAAKCPPFC